MGNPVKTIREARRKADKLLSSYEVRLASLVSQDADTDAFAKATGLVFTSLMRLPWWEFLRARRNVLRLLGNALERLNVRRQVAEPGIAQIYAMKTMNVRDLRRWVYAKPETEAYLTPHAITASAPIDALQYGVIDDEWPDEIEID